MASGPLTGVRVVELAGLGPAPFAAMMLAELGADVVKIDRPGGVGPLPPEHNLLNRGRPSVCIDLKQPAGADVVRRLVDRAAGLWSDRREANLLDGGMPFYAVYETRDGRHMAVGPLEPQFYAEFERLLDLAQPLPERTDTDTRPQLRTAIAARFATRTQRDWADLFADSDACVSPVLTMTEASTHPHLAERATLVEHDGTLQPSPAPRFSRTTTTLTTGPTQAGADARKTLLRWGIDDVVDLIGTGIVVEPEDVDGRTETEH